MTDSKAGSHFNLMCDIGQLAELIADSNDIESFLSEAVQLVACHLKADVGSIYLYAKPSEELVLVATVGLNPDAVGAVRMGVDQGLVGKAFTTGQSIRAGHARQEPSFKYFPEAGEDPYESLLAVPLQRGPERIGVLVVQREVPDAFAPIDGMALRAIASQLAGAVANARAVMDAGAPVVSEPPVMVKGPVIIHGRSGAGGFAQGPALVGPSGRIDAWDSHPLEAFDATLDGFHRAIRLTRDQLSELQARLHHRLPEGAALIFDAHFMMLKDQRFQGRIAEMVVAGSPPADAVRSVGREYIDRFRNSDSPYIQEKADDIADLTHRLLGNLFLGEQPIHASAAGHVVIARQLFPSDVLKLAGEAVAGIVLTGGGVTSHVAILARSLKIPLVMTDDPRVGAVAVGTPMLLDADVGNIYLAPSEAVVRHFDERNRAHTAVAPMADTMQAETRTRDGDRIRLMANINLLSEVPLAVSLKADGVGLYRTEFPFLVRAAFPSEEEQFIVYRRLIEPMAGKPVVFRTLDVGGEKQLPYALASAEINPELGLRATRFSLSHPEIFAQQIRAILRAGADAPEVRIMFPMIGSVDEFLAARRVVDDSLAALAEAGVAHHPAPAVGMMIELPSVVDLMPALVRIADFFSIGTNDFIQYMLAVDRSNNRVAAYYQPHHPAVLRALARVIDAATAAARPISVCGEMARDPRMIPFLLGVGLRQLSVDPRHLAAVQRTVAGIDLVWAEEYAKTLLAHDRLDATAEVIDQWMPAMQTDS